MTVRTGGCLCGAVRYEVVGPLAPIQLCHCGQCRKAQGSAFGANIPVSRATFRLQQGEAELQEYSASPGKRRVFCGACGSPLFSERDAAPDVIRLRAGSLDDTDGLDLGFHIQTASKAAWWPIADDLPIYPGAGPG
ncbi:MAG: GFA family protein [Phenylobacterium sp.]|uniref:GFA family protein n=1 Tax=Phenylobacterium sp. TaxID=1871053 RepID=UPI001A28EACF|nr:GFA family protein [Phenylobacterium sp.]MBJ7408997.1 GFA family protein [Phenylobacterium sp.]